MRYSASCRGFKSRPLRHPPQLPFLPARSHGGLPRCRRKRSVLRLATLQRGHPLAIPGCCPGVARIRPERASLLRRRSASGRNRDPTRRAAARARDADRRRLRRRRRRHGDRRDRRDRVRPAGRRAGARVDRTTAHRGPFRRRTAAQAGPTRAVRPATDGRPADGGALRASGRRRTPIDTNPRPRARPRDPAAASRYHRRAVLGGEPAVPCTCNPLQQGRIPSRGPRSRELGRHVDVEDRVPRSGDA